MVSLTISLVRDSMIPCLRFCDYTQSHNNSNCCTCQRLACQVTCLLSNIMNTLCEMGNSAIVSTTQIIFIINDKVRVKAHCLRRKISVLLLSDNLNNIICK